MDVHSSSSRLSRVLVGEGETSEAMGEVGVLFVLSEERKGKHSRMIAKRQLTRTLISGLKLCFAKNKPSTTYLSGKKEV